MGKKIALLVLPLFAGYRLYCQSSVFYGVLLIATVLLLIFTWRRKKGVESVLSFGVSYIFIDIIVNQLNFAMLWQKVAAINILPVLASLILMLLGLVFTALRWRCLLSGVKQLRFSDVFPSLMIGYFFNTILPAKAGEMVKAYHLGEKNGLSKMSVFATVVMERAFDGVVILVFLITSLLIFKPGEYGLRYAIGGAVVLYLGVLVVLIILYKFPKHILRIVSYCLPRKYEAVVTGKLQEFIDGLKLFQNPGQIITALLYSLIGWFFIAASIHPLFYAIKGYDFIVYYYMPFFIIAIIAIGQSLPAAPASVGVLNWSIIFAMQVIYRKYDIPVSPETYTCFFLFSLLIHFVMVCPEAVLGFYYFLKEKQYVKI